MSRQSASRLDESRLSHPREKPIFVTYVVINLLILATVIALVILGDEWVKLHPLLARFKGAIKAGALAGVLLPPSLVLIRRFRRGYIRGNSIRLSRHQIPNLYSILEAHCQKLGIEVPEFYLSDTAISGPAEAFTVWKKDFIVLSTDFLERNPSKVRDVISFLVGAELGRLRLGHTKWWYEMLVSHVTRTPYVGNPLLQVQALSRDRYGARLEPKGLRGLLIYASGRRVIDSVNIDDFVRQSLDYRSFWGAASIVVKKEPMVAYRIQALHNAGMLPTSDSAAQADAPAPVVVTPSQGKPTSANHEPSEKAARPSGLSSEAARAADS